MGFYNILISDSGVDFEEYPYWVLGLNYSIPILDPLYYMSGTVAFYNLAIGTSMGSNDSSWLLN